MQQHQEWAQRNHHHFTDRGIRIILEKVKKKKANGGRPAAERKPIQRYPTDRNHIVKPQFCNKYELLFTCNKIATKIALIISLPLNMQF